MADKLKDAEDEMLESLFAAEPIADDGFSEQIVRRIRRRVWIKRLSLPVAAAIGGIIALKPAVSLVRVLAELALKATPPDMLATSFDWLPPLHLIVAGVLLLAVAMFSVGMLED